MRRSYRMTRLVRVFVGATAAAIAVALVTPAPRAQVSGRAVDRSGADQLRYNSTTGQYAYGTRSGTWSPAWRPYPGDFNADGLTDYLLYNSNTGRWFREVNNGDGTFGEIGGTWDAGWTAVIGDFDGDSRADVFLYNSGTGAWARGINVGSTVDFSYVNGTWNPGWRVFLGEFSGDALDDLFLYNATSGEEALAISTANGFTTVGGRFDAGWDQIGVGDFDGDRDSDLFVYNSGTGRWAIVRTGAGSTFSTASDGTFDPGWVVNVGDLTGEGDADVLLYNPTTGTYVQAINDNDGSGSFRFFRDAWSTNWTLNCSEFSGDTRMDCVLYNRNTGIQYLATATGSGTFSYSSTNWGADWGVFTPDLTPPNPAPPAPVAPPPPPVPACGGEICDDLNGSTLGWRQGGQFTGGGWQATRTDNFIRYQVPTMTAGVADFDMTNIRLGTEEYKSKVYTMYDGDGGDVTTNPYRFTVDKRSSAFGWNGHVRARMLVGCAQPQCEFEARNSSTSWNPSETYHWRIEWGNGGWNIRITRQSDGGTHVNIGTGYRGVYQPFPHIIELGSPDRGETYVGAIWKNFVLTRG